MGTLPPAPTIHIRPFKAADLTPVTALVHRTIDISYRPDYPASVIDFFKEYHPRETIRHDARNGYTIVATEDDIIVGTGTLLGTNVRRVFVSPDRQHGGIGALIFNELEKKAVGERRYILDLSSALGAKSFWEAHGFVIEEECYAPKDEQVIHYYNMVKILGAMS
jgi:GNAT superfamily N-acetyltransferase